MALKPLFLPEAGRVAPLWVCPEGVPRILSALELLETEILVGQAAMTVGRCSQHSSPGYPYPTPRMPQDPPAPGVLNQASEPSQPQVTLPLTGDPFRPR